MAQGKKHTKGAIKFKSVSSSYVHPSLATTRSSVESQRSDQQQESNASVNEQIQYLRRVQQPRPAVVEAESAIEKLRISTAPPIRVAGPPPPKSWRRGDVSDGSGSAEDGDYSRRHYVQRPKRLDYFPGAKFPPQTSLMHQAMKSLARDFDWHLEYDHAYLSILPVEMKPTLMTYIACYGEPEGISTAGLKTLMATAGTSGLEGSTGGADSLDRLDLSVSIGHAISFASLEKHWLRKQKPRHSNPEEPTPSSSVTSIPETWDESSPHPVLNDSPFRYPSLTKLSLAYPGKLASWSSLLEFSPNLYKITHLDLAGWPFPSFPSATTTASTAPTTTQQPVRPANDYDLLDEADFILRALARSTPSLTYLSLADWHLNFATLLHDPETTGPRRGTGPLRSTRRAKICFVVPDLDHDDAQVGNAALQKSLWATAWKQLRTLNLSQSGSVPDKINLKTLRQMYKQRDRWSSGDASSRYAIEQIAALDAQGAMEEAYVLEGPRDVVSKVLESRRRLQWIEREKRAIMVGHFVNAQRVGVGGLRMVSVEYGWGAEELREAGYSDSAVSYVTSEKVADDLFLYGDV